MVQGVGCVASAVLLCDLPPSPRLWRTSCGLPPSPRLRRTSCGLCASPHPRRGFTLRATRGCAHLPSSAGTDCRFCCCPSRCAVLCGFLCALGGLCGENALFAVLASSACFAVQRCLAPFPALRTLPSPGDKGLKPLAWCAWGAFSAASARRVAKSSTFRAVGGQV